MSDYKEYVSCPGSRFRPVYEPVIGDDGVITLRQIDVVDYYAKIQSDAPYCDIGYLLKRYSAGDSTALQMSKGFFADVTSAPHSLAEAYELNVRCESAFKSLPLAVREKFDHSYFKFLQAAGTDAFDKMLDIEPIETKEVKEPIDGQKS